MKIQKISLKILVFLSRVKTPQWGVGCKFKKYLIYFLSKHVIIWAIGLIKSLRLLETKHTRLLHLMVFGDLGLSLILVMLNMHFLWTGAPSQNTLFEKLHWMTFGDFDRILTSHDTPNAFSMHRSSKIDFLKICT